MTVPAESWAPHGKQGDYVTTLLINASRHKHSHTQSIDFTKVPGQFNWERTVFAPNGAGIPGYLLAKE